MPPIGKPVAGCPPPLPRPVIDANPGTWSWPRDHRAHRPWRSALAVSQSLPALRRIELGPAAVAVHHAVHDGPPVSSRGIPPDTGS
jgi:hypothetical protein